MAKAKKRKVRKRKAAPAAPPPYIARPYTCMGIAIVTRRFGGIEGPNIAVGTKLTVGGPPDGRLGLINISQARFDQLRMSGLVQKMDERAERVRLAGILSAALTQFAGIQQTLQKIADQVRELDAIDDERHRCAARPL